jgi:glycosyltransferase involved in cell wall biosynthesis
MLIAFDGAGLGDGPPTGVARAFLTGLQAYAARGEHAAVLLLPAGAPDPALPGVRVVAAPRGRLQRQLALPRLLRALRADVLHRSVAAVPLRAPLPAIATVHDLPWRHAEAGETTTPWRRFATARALRAAAAVLAPSAMTAADASALLGAHAAAKVRVVPHGCARSAPPTPAAIAARRGPFLLLGDDRPRKQRDVLRAAHARALAQAPDLPPLRFVGPPDDYVDEATKKELLRDCRALVHPSRFEGFGLPVLEGLAHGAPVVCSDLPPHREIAGDAAMYAPAGDVAAFAAALLAVHRDAALRARLATTGHARAADFAPERTAAAWAQTHREVAR